MTTLDEDLQRLKRLNILGWAMRPGGVDRWARIDRKVPGEKYGQVIVPQQRNDYDPGAMVVTEQTIARGIEYLQGKWTLDDLGIDSEFVGRVDDVLNNGGIQKYEPSFAAAIVQIGLFGSVWYQ